MFTLRASRESLTQQPGVHCMSPWPCDVAPFRSQTLDPGVGILSTVRFVGWQNQRALRLHGELIMLMDELSLGSGVGGSGGGRPNPGQCCERALEWRKASELTVACHVSPEPPSPLARRIARGLSLRSVPQFKQDSTRETLNRLEGIASRGPPPDIVLLDYGPTGRSRDIRSQSHNARTWLSLVGRRPV